MKRKYAFGVAMVAASLLAAACGDDDDNKSSAPAGDRTASAEGVTANQIDIGFVASTTGAAGPNNTGMVKAAKARVSLENDKGGVNGRKINLIDVDNASDTNRDLQVTQDLVESKKVFAVVTNNPFTFSSFRYLVEKQIPVVSGGYDGAPYGKPGNENLVPILVNDPTWSYDTIAKYIKDHGGTKVGSVGYGQSPSSTGSAKTFIDAAKAVGLEAPYLNTSIPFGSVEVAPIALALKNANVDGMWLPLNNNTNFAIVTAAKQAGVNMKAAISATGYGQSLLDEPTAVAAAEGSYFSVGYLPAEAGGAPITTMRDAFKKYASFTGIPGFDWYQGWISADLMIEGLKAAGNNPTRDSLLKGLRSLNAYDAGGLLPQKVDHTAAAYGKQPTDSCGYFVRLEKGKFVPDPAPKGLYCGKRLNP